MTLAGQLADSRGAGRSPGVIPPGGGAGAGYLEDIWLIYGADGSAWERQFSAHSGIRSQKTNAAAARHTREASGDPGDAGISEYLQR